MKSALLLPAFLFALAWARPAEGQTQSQRLVLLQMNDTHAYLEPHPEVFAGPAGPEYRTAGGFARIAAIANQARRENPGRVLFLDSGDTLHGTLPAQKSAGAVMLPVLNAMGLSGMTLHWEFAYGPPRVRELARRLNYPMLALNIYDKRTGSRVFPGTMVAEMDGGPRVGVIAIASNIVDKTMPASFSEGLRFTDGREELPQAIRDLRTRDKVDLVVLVSHLGFPQDMKLVSDVPGVDVVLSGHTHNRLYQPARQGNTLVIQSGSHGSFVGRLDLEVRDGRVVDWRHELIEVSHEIPPDPAVEKLVTQALAPYRAEMDQEVGRTQTVLDRAASLESSMDMLLIEAMLETTGAEVALANGWRFGTPIVPGKITLNDLYNIVPFNPPVSTVQLTGRDLQAALEESLEEAYSADPYRQMGGYVRRVGGIRWHVKIENPAGTRIQKLFVGDREVQPEQMYTVAFVGAGVPPRFASARVNTATSAVDAMAGYLARHGPLELHLPGNLVVE